LVLSSHLLKGRVAHILLMLGNNVYGSDTFLMPINRKEMAEMINMSVENVIRTLSEFRREKIIEIEGKQIRLLNKPLLKQIEMLG
jgi:CRP/FNR family transcriptional regulator